MTNLESSCSTHMPKLQEDHHIRLASIFKLLGDSGRLCLVLACIDTPQTVTQLSQLAAMSQPLTSHHLRQLREARILRSTRNGKPILYQLDDFHIRHVLIDMATHVIGQNCTSINNEAVSIEQ